MGLLDCSHAAEPLSASAILQQLREFRECGSVLYIAAHPDDENTQFIAYVAKARAMRVGYLSLTRGEGGQDLIGPEIGDPLGVIRTQELLAARRIDGGEQFFTCAKDFGFSKDYEQTLAKWDRQAVLSDVVRVIREFKPDVIVTRFPPEAGGTHGHHTASTVLALEAFKFAGEATYPGNDEHYPAPWQPKRIFWNAFRGNKDRPTLKLDIGGYIPLLGESVGEIAALSRSCHRSQGYGSIANRDPRLDEFQPLDGKPIGKDLFDGIDTSWRQFPGGDKIDALASEIITRFNPIDPSASVPALLELKKLERIASPASFPRYYSKGQKLDAILQACLGLHVETTLAHSEMIIGDLLKCHHQATMRSSPSVPVRWLGVFGTDAEYNADAKQGPDEREMHPNQPVVRDTTDLYFSGGVLTHPYWLRDPGTPGMYRIAPDAGLVGLPDTSSRYEVIQEFMVGSEYVEIPVEPVQIMADPAKGEIHQQLTVIAPVSLTPTCDVQLFAPGSVHPVEVEVKAFRDDQKGSLALAAPAGWKVEPESQPLHLAASGDHARFRFNVTAPMQPQTVALGARATIDGKTYDTSRQEIRYEHIPPQLLQPPARVKAVCLDLAIRGKQIGYLPGAGDRVAESIAAMGYDVTLLTGADLTTDQLKRFDAIMIGVRAFNVRTDLASGLNALFAYAENGGNIVIQYNTPNELKTTRLAPFNLELSRDLPHNRVTNENAPVTLLVPGHPVFNTPNKISPADFDGWVQERGLNFPSTWDPDHFTALLACSDPGEAPLRSGLLVADYGKGHIVYTGLSFFRQLPAGVPGAYRLFANLVSLGN